MYYYNDTMLLGHFSTSVLFIECKQLLERGFQLLEGKCNNFTFKMPEYIHMNQYRLSRIFMQIQNAFEDNVALISNKKAILSLNIKL